MKVDNYVLDPKIGVYVRPANTDIGYTDGGEQKLLEIMDEINDKSTFSNELKSHMNDWPSEYHLSRKRHLIVRNLGIKSGDRVLELGCGCGVITRYLLEIGAKVTAVEGEVARAAVAAKRCAGFPAVQFIADDFLRLDLEQEYDWVLMIGVFEYSQKYGKTADRQAEYLQIARRHLSTNGALVVAIENKVGIKYFNGATEDHNGKLHYGPHDLYEGRDITTWGRKELSDILFSNGFKYQHFSGVFPDYKLPRIVLDESINKNQGFRAEELLLYSRSLDYHGSNTRFFDESLVAGALRKNRLLVDMANSLLVTAKMNSPVDHDPERLAIYYTVDRKSEYCTETFFSSFHDKILVKKRLLNSNGLKASDLVSIVDVDGALIQIEHKPDRHSQPYHHGLLLGLAFAKAIQRDNLEAAGVVLQEWLSYVALNFSFYNRTTGQLLRYEDLNGKLLSNVLIDGDAIDCGPQNIVMDENPVAFDLEWRAINKIPMAWFLTRNCQHILRQSHSQKMPIQLKDLVGVTAEYLGVTATTEDVEEALALERKFQEAVGYAEPSNHIRLGCVR